MARSNARVAFALVALLGTPAALRADEGWVIERFGIQIAIQPDGVLAVDERIDVDFRNLSRHGIFRDVYDRFDYDDTRVREYSIDLTAVTGSDGRRLPVKESEEGPARRFRIGDPDRTITGKQNYRITYRIRQALNGFADHDELYWNVTGTWPVAMNAVSVSVTAPGPITEVHCFQGPAGSKDSCGATMSGTSATFASTRVLEEGEQMTIVASLPKGAVTAPVPRLRPKSPSLFPRERPGWTKPVMFSGLGAAFAGVVALWWRLGRDRQYVALHREDKDTQGERVPLLGARPIAVEFEPPEHITPAELGLIVDERADTLDVTATIVDLAVRGYLKITELPKHGWFTHQDWQLDRLKPADSSLREYEAIVLDGLFGGASTKKLSELKNKFYRDLAKAKTALYTDAVERGWFPRSPQTVRQIWLVLGFVTLFGGVFLVVYLSKLGEGALGLPVVAAGVLLVLVSRLMPRRTPAGSQMLYRSLGFAKYIKTAETQTQAFAERANIFTAYLPYAIVFKCVERWARAFKDIDLQAATAGFYAGSTPFSPGSFASTFGSFSSSVSQSLASTPGGSGGSGSGGSSGGGGGGGGGGSW